MVWGIENSRELYGLKGVLNNQLFDINEKGELVVKIKGKTLSIAELLKKHGLPGANIRILPWIGEMIDYIAGLFLKNIRENNYRGEFRPVYPLKVNHHELVLRSIKRYGGKYSWGWEAGTLPELYEALSIKTKGLLVVDGVKDFRGLKRVAENKEAYGEAIIDIESIREARLLEELREHIGDKIWVGFRIRPMFRGESIWSSSSGLSSKFGLPLSSIYKIIEKQPWIKDKVIMLHFHYGSQIVTKDALKKMFTEMINTYTVLKEKYLPNLRYIDTGGGLAFDYESTLSGSSYSPDYTFREYVEIMVKTFKEHAEEQGVLPPDIVFESGRAIVAPHRISAAKVIDIRPYISESGTEIELIEKIQSSKTIKELSEIARESENIINRLLSFTENIDLKRRELLEGMIKTIYEEIARKTKEIYLMDKDNALKDLAENTRTGRPLYRFLTSPSRRFVLSFSLFNVLPDYVILNQYFQIVPCSMLDKRPDVLATISDITCDSMGEISEFISKLPEGFDDIFTEEDNRLLGIPGKRIILRGIPLHLPRENEEYYVAFLHTGAYQDPLAMGHNMLEEYPEIIIDENNDGELIIRYEDNVRDYYPW